MSEQDHRTTLTIPGELVDAIDQLLVEDRASRKVSRALSRNAYVVQLLEERVSQRRREVPTVPEVPAKDQAKKRK